ncbi:MAG: hypothetical protein K6F61_11795 [Clostridiales bacterium]|nr:hypothetical protein [Clostridiales bacterium]
MKKLVCVILAAVLAMIACAAAFANDTAVDLYDKTAILLFEHNNLTLNVNAKLSLDGQWFKTVEGTWKQDGANSFRKLHLRSPKADGTERENGYTIVTEGYYLYLMEDFTPGFYRPGITGDRASVLRNTAESKQLVSLGRALVSQADLILGKDAITKADNGDIVIKIGDDAPALLNAALNQAYQFAVRRFFNVDYDRILAEGSYATIRDYGTVSQGILYCARGFSLRNAEITVKMGEHYPAHAEGSIGLYMETAEEGVRRLDISFEADATDIGDTMLKKFDPADYGVELAPDAVDYGQEEPYQPVLDAALKDQMELDAMDIWRPAGFNTNATAPVSCEWDEYNYIVTIRDGDGIDKKTFFDETGRFYHMEASPNDWWDGILSIEEYNTEPQLDSETDGKAKAFFMEYLENIHYEQRNQVKDLRVQWTFEKNGNLYACYEDKADPNGEGVYFVIRISPEMRIESYSCISNG